MQEIQGNSTTVVAQLFSYLLTHSFLAVDFLKFKSKVKNIINFLLQSMNDSNIQEVRTIGFESYYQ